MEYTDPTLNKIFEHCKSVNTKVLFEYDLSLLKHRIIVHDLISHKIFEMNFYGPYDILKKISDAFIITEIDKKLDEVRCLTMHL